MKASLLLVGCLLLTAPLGAATLEWTVVLGTDSPPINVSADQIIADGSGGCVIIWESFNSGTTHTDVRMARLDKKGTEVWRRTYENTDNIEFGMVDKTRVVASVSPESADDYVIVIDKKGVETVVQEVGAPVFCDINGEDGPTGDKKGFFVVVARASGELVLQRWSYK